MFGAVVVGKLWGGGGSGSSDDEHIGNTSI